MKNIIVIGGGASGMMAAGVAAERGMNVQLFEKNNRLGRKLYITGKGRCNVTNHVPVESLLDHVPGNPTFLYSSFYTFDAEALILFFNKLGVEMKTERGNRVFPVSDKSGDIIDALEQFLRRTNVQTHMGSEIKEIVIENKTVKGVLAQNGKFYKSDAVIVATGGLSYPATGSTGDGYRFAREAGHKVTKLNPSLVPFVTEEEWVPSLQGLSLKNIGIHVTHAGKSIYKDFGEMLFTHQGVSGPVILSASRHIVGCNTSVRPVISIDLKPALTDSELDKRVLRDFEKYRNKALKNSLDDLLPQKLIPVMIQLLNISPEKKVHDITKEERKKIVRTFKNFCVTIKGTTGYKEAVITTGGVSVDEINPGTMQSKIISGLYFTGEVIDVDALTGGFNLQIAFSTGYLAGISVE